MVRPLFYAAPLLAAALAQSAMAASPPKKGAAPAAPAGAVEPGTAPPAMELGGAGIKGVCFLSQPVMVNTAKFPLAANKRLQELESAAQAEVNGLRAPLDVDLKQLQADAAKTPAPANLDQRRTALQARYQQLQNTTDQRNREMQATRIKVIQRVAGETQPVIAAVYKAHGCGLLLAREAALGGNLQEDLTPEVIKALDAKITTITFDREVLTPAPAK